ncbi:hypothetical protein GCM10007368_25200 [Isoptericola cucumis]|uniref:Uncharacterized protein n=1 Tax=Isoptericola cucumis TaxID=1776856 RepID=A0ABQ2BAM2_9MICO|nr:hypothetical protein GCM10007368_25200 [Isoptericola cucumis]
MWTSLVLRAREATAVPALAVRSGADDNLALPQAGRPGRVFLLGHRARGARLPDRHAEGVSPVTLDLGKHLHDARQARKGFHLLLTRRSAPGLDRVGRTRWTGRRQPGR